MTLDEYRTPDPDDETPPPEEPRGAFGPFDEILRKPRWIYERASGESSVGFWLRLGLGALACLALYGAAAGFFQGGGQILIAALKAPLIVIGSLILCLPSLYVFASLAGIEVSGAWLKAAGLGLIGMLGLLLAAFLPIAWLFSVSSRSIVFVAFLHTLFWFIALGFGLGFLRRLVRTPAATGALFLWTMLVFVVSLQVASQLRPVLYRPAGMGIFEPERRFFLEHYEALWGDEGEKASPEPRDGG